MELIKKKCIPCEGGTPPFDQEKIKEYLAQLKSDWEVLENRKIRKEFKFKDFLGAIAFVNKVAEIAEQEDHHPDIHISYRKVLIELWTHAVGGLSENDFIVAAKIELLTV